MPIRIDVRADIKQAQRELNLIAKQVPFAAALAINAVLKKSQPAVQAEMRRVFDRPTPWTLNSYRVLQWAKKSALIGVVGFKGMQNIGGRGTPAGEYLQPQMEGGPRPAKGLEREMRAVGMLGNNEFLVPSRFMKLDQYGNVGRGVVNAVRANLRTMRFDAASQTPRGGPRRKVGAKKFSMFYFTRAGVRGQRLTAIWQRFTGGHAVPAFIVVAAAPRYRKRFDQAPVVQREVDKNFRPEFEAAYARAVATAR
jgi:hypothetical protein